MNRREAILGAGVMAVTSTVNMRAEGAVDVVTGERQKQYAICKERGHVGGDVTFTNAVIYPEGYVHFSQCKFCGTSFRFVTSLEEANTP